MATLFIADLHLQTEEPAITAGFLRFLAGEAREADALYILGDLFEAWIGDDDPNPLHQQIASAINALTQSGVPCYFVHGNRDFLVGQRFARACGMRLLAEENKPVDGVKQDRHGKNNRFKTGVDVRGGGIKAPEVETEDAAALHDTEQMIAQCQRTQTTGCQQNRQHRDAGYRKPPENGDRRGDRTLL